ncbi:dynein, cytoplasmic 1, intermediate chain 2a-like isoform X1 [Convolutriloba macropyga]|uniref:dynein, cytoplasmic 1, intermediate chain 2a-like isoform X1 n=1 Tax=Convolutriloba macropyga TaxID=536237 RepID=UPI003F5287E7
MSTPVKDELARKKEKLEEMRRKKAEMQKHNQEKQKQKLRGLMGMDQGDTSTGAAVGGAASSDRWSNADDIFREFDIQGVPQIQSSSVGVDPSTSQSSGGVLSTPPSGPSGAHLEASAGEGSLLSSSGLGASGRSLRQVAKLEMAPSIVNSVDIPPVESYLYPKETQTDDYLLPQPTMAQGAGDGEEGATGQKEDIDEGKKEEEKDVKEQGSRSASPVPVAKELTDEEKAAIVSSEGFLTFLTRSSQLVERKITHDPDVYKCYTQEDDDKSSSMHPGSQVKVSRVFYQDYWCNNSAVSSLDWSPFFPNELVLASYHSFSADHHPAAQSESGGSLGGLENSGLAMVWNLGFNADTPDAIYQCQTSVVNAVFAKFHQNLIVGGTYSGRVVIWDSRNNKRSPVQRTALPTQGHTHPVFCTEVVGTENAHNLITISSDGKLCSWSLDMLSEPQETVDLQSSMGKTQTSKHNSVPVKCMSFPSNEYNSFVVGAEDGYIYGAVRHGSKPGITDIYERHYAPVTSVDLNQCPGPVDFSHLFVSSSFDWSTKLWSTKTPGRALHSLEGLGEYVTEARWCPTHPATFCTALTTGRLDIWNLNHDTEVPLSSMQLDGSPAIIKAKWSQNGRNMVIGDDAGKIHVADIGENICTPQPDAWSNLVHTLSELQSQTTEIDQWSDTSSNY